MLNTSKTGQFKHGSVEEIVVLTGTYPLPYTTCSHRVMDITSVQDFGVKSEILLNLDQVAIVSIS